MNRISNQSFHRKQNTWKWIVFLASESVFFSLCIATCHNTILLHVSNAFITVCWEVVLECEKEAIKSLISTVSFRPPTPSVFRPTPAERWETAGAAASLRPPADISFSRNRLCKDMVYCLSVFFTSLSFSLSIYPSLSLTLPLFLFLPLSLICLSLFQTAEENGSTVFTPHVLISKWRRVHLSYVLGSATCPGFLFKWI